MGILRHVLSSMWEGVGWMDALPQPGGITADFGLLTISFLWGTQVWEPSQGFRRQTHTREQIQQIQHISSRLVPPKE